MKISIVPPCGNRLASLWLASLASAVVLLSPLLLPARAGAEPASAGAALTARVLSPTEKIKLLEDDLAQETDKRVKLEEEVKRRNTENAELIASTKTLQRDKAALEAKVAASREHEAQLQRANDRLDEELHRTAISVRILFPVIAAMTLVILGMIVWLLRFLRQVASRVHGQKTLAQMHELEGRLIHTNDLLNAELKRSQALRQKLAELGVDV